MGIAGKNKICFFMAPNKTVDFFSREAKHFAVVALISLSKKAKLEMVRAKFCFKFQLLSIREP